ncbi:sulfite exporter TauE/SafE family protein [Thioclava sp. GXIMD2076]|uniref:nickel/cobalt transporter n=1 Tax=Thioclava sp. GXIMD2076 TaxID=3131931 RepID=UPI0030D5C3C9
MRWVMLAACAVILGFAALWGLGVFQGLHFALLDIQRSFQSVLARAMRALKADHPGARASLIWLSFLYGVVHAAGPGHGKMVLGSWAFASKARLARVAGLTLTASLAQSLCAIGIVVIGASVLGLGRQALTELAEGPVTQLGNILIGALGAYLMARALLGLWRSLRKPRTQHHHHHEGCGCSHAHAPDPEKSARASLPQALLLIGSVAFRPCTGGLFVMLLAWLIGAPWTGAWAVLAMGVGTAVVTLAIALAAGHMGNRFARRPDRPWLGIAGRFFEMALGAIILAIAI